MPGSPHCDRAPIRLTRRGRAVLVGVAATATLMSLWLTGGPGAFAGDHQTHRIPAHPPRTVTVEPGDTLWGIAAVVEPGADPRRVVQRILDLNGLGGDPTVQPGQRLRVPGR